MTSFDFPRGNIPALSLTLALLLAGCAQPPGTPGVTMAPGPLQRMTQGLSGWTVPGIGGTGGAATAPGQVTDPFAGQGVQQRTVEPPKTVAPTPTPAAPAGTTTAPATTHTVVAGETGWSVARKYGVTIQDLARANGLSESMTIRVGQRLTIPAAGQTATAANVVTAPGQGSPTPQPPSSQKPLPAERTTPAAAPVARAETPNLGATRTAASGSGRFAMPVQGAIIRGYEKGKNDGIDIAAAPGATVKAAGAGTVAAVTKDTAGTPIVVVRHDGGLLTVYAGLDSLSVAKGDSLSSGQAIGKARSKGAVHFEVRNGYDSVDPETYLK